MMNSGKGGGDLVRKSGAPPSKKTYPPQTLLGLRLGHVAIASYTDEKGKPHQQLMFVIDGVAYAGADGEKWFATQLGKPAPWLAEQMAPVIEEQMARMYPTLPDAASAPSAAQENHIDVMAMPAATSAAPLPVTGVDPSTRARLTGTPAR